MSFQKAAHASPGMCTRSILFKTGHGFCILKEDTVQITRVYWKSKNLLFNRTIECKELHEFVDASQGWHVPHNQIPVKRSRNLPSAPLNLLRNTTKLPNQWTNSHPCVAKPCATTKNLQQANSSPRNPRNLKRNGELTETPGTRCKPSLLSDDDRYDTPASPSLRIANSTSKLSQIWSPT